MKKTLISLMLVLIMGFSLHQESWGSPGTIGLKSAGALSFTPDGILFVGDNVGGAIYAFDVGKGTAPEKPAPVDVDNIDARVGSILGVGPRAIVINDMAVHPEPWWGCPILVGEEKQIEQSSK